jgi:hypothetical protein
MASQHKFIKCGQWGCSNKGLFSDPDIKKFGVYCAGHASGKMIRSNEECVKPECAQRAAYGPKTGIAVSCAEHKSDEMVLRPMNFMYVNLQKNKNDSVACSIL